MNFVAIRVLVFFALTLAMRKTILHYFTSDRALFVRSVKNFPLFTQRSRAYFFLNSFYFFFSRCMHNSQSTENITYFMKKKNYFIRLSQIHQEKKNSSGKKSTKSFFPPPLYFWLRFGQCAIYEVLIFVTF